MTIWVEWHRQQDYQRQSLTIMTIENRMEVNGWNI
jgi:hypothetical protein